MDSKQWPVLSQTKMIGLIMLILALMLFLALMVLVSQKSTKKKIVSTIPPASPIIQSSPIPDLTKDWQVISKRDFSLKAPTGSRILYKENINSASGSAFLELRLDPQKEATQQGILVIEVRDKNSGGEKVDPGQQVYLLNLNAPTTKRVITKPIEILIGGNKGYEFYLESSGIKGYLGNHLSALGKNRVINFDKDNKSYLIFLTMDAQLEQILNTLTFKPSEAETFDIAGLAMYPNYKKGQKVATQKYQNNQKPVRGDVVIITPPSNTLPQIKRIIGLPEETVKIENGHIYIDGKLLTEPYLDKQLLTLPGAFLKEGLEVKVGSSNYVVIGDNRTDSSDSRDYGLIPETSIITKVTSCILNCNN